ncbi:hypothetical protein HPB51_022084 [Rhipicephalus microplus]|uniref:SET domain-containing protein n=1 Tax=Rhipicephalus microplus TaxID=6941 RepID=A0A9J6EIV0_RHIMP|nr:hypothetical protein HPB51_022084 [Rhipicephalus microplus]
MGRPADPRSDRQAIDGGRVCFLVDGADTMMPSWMTYVQCARHEQEQNLDMLLLPEGSLYYRVTKCRRKYLRQFKDVRRHGRPIFYTSETWANAGHTVSRGWVDKTSTEHAKKANLTTGLPNPSGKEGRLIITHCGNEDGFITAAGEVFRATKGTGDYHDEMDGANL